jgi:FKBP-type peptidyl-prolyl cis-trans isomerase FkpA
MRRLAPLLLLLAACGPRPAAAPPSTEYSYKPANAFEEAAAREEGARPIKFGGWIRTLSPGTGASPTHDSVVKVHYRGTLTDGKEFDGSTGREPVTFPLRSVIQCWTFGVPMMKVGEKARFVCPASAAYGDAGAPPNIPGGATLAFEIELLEIVK